MSRKDLARLFGAKEVRHHLNPAWDYIKNVPHDKLLARGDRFTPANFSLDFEAEGAERFKSYRDRATSRWTWAIPAPDTLDFIVQALNGRPVVEIGAGNGYWAWQLAQMGVDIVAYDPHPVGHPDSWFSEEHALRRGGEIGSYEDPIEEFHPVLIGDAKAIFDHQDRVLLLIWPTMDSWAYDAVRHYDGDTVIFIGEGPGGCTADSNFFSFMGDGCGCWGENECLHKADDAVFEAAAYGPMTQWSGLHDHLTIYNRKETL